MSLARIVISGDLVRIPLSWPAKLAALVGNQSFPLAAVTAVALIAEPAATVPGVRSPGLSIPGVAKVGVWRQEAQRSLVAVRRGQPAVSIEVSNQHFQRYLIGHEDAAAIAEQLRRTILAA